MEVEIPYAFIRMCIQKGTCIETKTGRKRFYYKGLCVVQKEIPEKHNAFWIFDNTQLYRAMFFKKNSKKEDLPRNLKNKKVRFCPYTKRQ